MLLSQALRRDTEVKILIVDDEIKLLEALSKYLESKGFYVSIAKSTAEALNLLETIVPDVLIVDVIMPCKNGYDFILEIKKNKKFNNTPFIFLTAKGMTKDRIQGYQLGCRSYITKPFDPEELISVVNSIIFETKDINNIREIRDEIKKIRLLLENKNKTYVQLTPREKIILLEVIEGHSNQEIGKKIKISTRSVEKYVTRLLNKTYSRNRTDLVKFAYKFLRANDENRTRE